MGMSQKRKKHTGRSQCNKVKRRFSNKVIQIIAVIADPVTTNHGSIRDDDITK